MKAIWKHLLTALLLLVVVSAATAPAYAAPEEDAARLAVFTLTYHPPFTPLKLELAAELLRECALPLILRLPVLEQALAGEAEALCARRGAPEPWRDQLEKALRQLLLIISYSPVFR